MIIINVVSCKKFKLDKEIFKNLDSSGIDFPVSKKDYGKIEDLNKTNFNVFYYENKVVFPVYLSNRKFSYCLDLLLIFDYYMYIKDFNRLMFNKNKNKNKKYFCKSCLQCFSSENVLNNHKEDCSLINGKQNVKLEKGFISFKNYSRQIPVPFKIYADFGCILKGCNVGVDNDCFSYTRKYQNHVPCGFAYKVVCIDNRFSKDVVLYREKDVVSKFIRSVLKECSYCKEVIKKHFNKNFVMTAEENERFERSNIC